MQYGAGGRDALTDGDPTTSWDRKHHTSGMCAGYAIGRKMSTPGQDAAHGLIPINAGRGASR